MHAWLWLELVCVCATTNPLYLPKRLTPTSLNPPPPTNYFVSSFRRAQKVVIKTVDVSYGGENGFNQAIELAGETLGSVKLIQVRVCVRA